VFISKAVELYEEARRQGHTDAVYNLGTLYKKQGNMSKAVELYEEARRQGHTGAIFNLNVGDALPQSNPPLPQSTPPDGWTRWMDQRSRDTSS